MTGRVLVDVLVGAAGADETHGAAVIVIVGEAVTD